MNQSLKWYYEELAQYVLWAKQRMELGAEPREGVALALQFSKLYQMIQLQIQELIIDAN